MIVGLLMLLSLTAFAETRESQVSLGGTTGPDDYQSRSADALIGVGDEWQIIGSYYRSDSGKARLTNEELTSIEGRVGADWKFHENAGVYVEGIRRSDPYELKGKGAQFGGHYILSSLWKGKRKTRLSLNAQELRFSQDVTFTGPRASLNIKKDTSQRKGSISLLQEITDWMEISVNFTRYNYAGETNRLNFITARRRTSWGGAGPSYGQPDRSGSLGLTFYPWEWMETTFSGNRTRILGEDQAESQSFIVNQTFFWKGFSLGIEYVSTTYTEGSSGNDPATQEYWGSSLGYEW